MAADDLENDYHLTPNGWVPGDSRFFGKTTNSKPVPADRVLTLTKRIYQRSPYSPEETSVSETWRDDARVELITELRRKFPPPVKADE